MLWLRKAKEKMFSKKNKPTSNIKVKGEVLEQVDQFINLGIMVTSDGKCDTEIKRRIGIAKTSYKRLERVLTSKSVTLATWLRILKRYVWSKLQQSAEIWNHVNRQQKCGSFAECWRFHGLEKSPMQKCYSELTHVEIWWSQLLQDKFDLLVMFCQKNHWNILF